MLTLVVDIPCGKYLVNSVLASSVSNHYPSLPFVVNSIALQKRLILVSLVPSHFESPVVISPAIAVSHQISLKFHGLWSLDCCQLLPACTEEVASSNGRWKDHWPRKVGGSSEKQISIWRRHFRLYYLFCYQEFKRRFNIIHFEMKLIKLVLNCVLRRN